MLHVSPVFLLFLSGYYYRIVPYVAQPGFQVIPQPRGSSTNKQCGGVGIRRNHTNAWPLIIDKPSEFEVLPLWFTL